MNEFIPLSSAIENGNAPLPPCLSRLIEHAPDSFDDLRAGQIAATLRAMREAGDAITFATIGERKPKLIEFISLELMMTDLPLAPAEAEAVKCWNAYQVRRAKMVCADLVNDLDASPDKVGAILENAQTALAGVTSATHNGLPELLDAADFIVAPIEVPAELIAGILQRGSKLVFGGSSKSFKTWSLLDVAISVATGERWLGFETIKGKVVFLNFEIQPHAWQQRIKAVAEAKGVTLNSGMIQLWNLRGYAADFRQIIPRIIQRCRRENFALIVLDPIYKLYGGTDENAAGDVAELLNSLERLATETGAAVAFGAHFAKGNASAKEAIDRISGSGVFARDPDSLLIFTKHEADDAFTIEPILRNFAPVEPFTVRWQFPLMHLADDLDPSKLKQAGGRKPIHQPDDLLALLPPDGLTNAEWITKAGSEGISRAKFFRLRKPLKTSKKIHHSTISGKWQPILTK